MRIISRLVLGLSVLVMVSGQRAAEASERVAMPHGFEPGSVVVSTRQRMLYFINDDGTAIRYPVAVGMPGRQWFGTRTIDGKHYRPAWSPPAEVRRAKPSLPDVIPGGAPDNPMGAGALTIAPGEYAIHGTSASMRASIGRYASFGCIRMLDEDVLDLMARVRIPSRITVVK